MHFNDKKLYLFDLREINEENFDLSKYVSKE
jgi:hypothetical protein